MEDDSLSYKAVLQDMGPAFRQGQTYELTTVELMVVYFALARLADLERFAEARDWESLIAYNPVPGED